MQTFLKLYILQRTIHRTKRNTLLHLCGMKPTTTAGPLALAGD